jgi:beta-phosphoglucomutase-like phosphatase (HAD superfamily)
VTTVIFDLDGVLVDSEPLWQQGFADVVNAFSVEQGYADPRLRPEDMTRFHGGRVKDTVRTLVEEQGLGALATEATIAGLTERVVEDAAAQLSDEVVIGSSVEVARRLHEDGARLAVASSSAQRFIDAVVERLGLSEVFEVTQSALELDHGKPHPEVYEITLDRLGARAKETLAIEDSVPGVQSALRAGLAVVWLTPYPAEEALALLGDDDPAGVKMVTQALDYDALHDVTKELV